MIIANQRIRLAIDTSQMGNINDVITGATPQFWNGVDLQFELAVFYGATLSDISNFDSITIDLKKSDPRTGLPLMSATIPSNQLNESLTLQAWQGGAPADCHALVTFTNAQTNLELSDDTDTFWLVVSALTADSLAHKIVLGATPLNVTEGGEGVTPPASVVEPTYYTAAQSDARFQRTVDLTAIDNSISTLNGEMTAVTATADAALPKAGGTVTGLVTLSGVTGVLKAPAGVVTGGATTSDLPEGANLYWTQARFNVALAAVAGAASGVCPLDSSSLIPAQYLPSITVHDTFVVSSQSAMLALPAHQGDVAIRTDVNETFILVSGSAATLGNWAQLLSPTSPVTSVNSLTGAVTLTTMNISEGTNLYYTTARAQADALAATLTGFSSSSGGTILSTDSILAALGKVENRLAADDAKADGSNRVLKAGDMMTGPLNFSGTTNPGITVNNLTSAQRTALTGAAGMLVYDTTLAQLMYYTSGAWAPIGAGAGTVWFGLPLNGSAPPGTTGQPGNWCLDTGTGEIWQNISGTWTLIYAPSVAGFVPLAGGTMTGGLGFSGAGNPGLTLNNLSNTQQGALTAGAGTVVYNTTETVPSYYNGSSWIPLNVIYNVGTGRLQFNNGSGFTNIGVSGVGGGGGASAPVTKTSNYTMAASDSLVIAAAQSITITLPTSPVAGQMYCVKGHFGTGTSSVAPNTGQTIDTSTTPLVLNPLGAYTLINDGTNWWIISSF
jgi:hypothetical protein